MAGAEPRTGVVVGVDRPRGDAVRLAGDWDVPVSGHSDAFARVDWVIVHGLWPRWVIRGQQWPENTPGSGVV